MGHTGPTFDTTANAIAFEVAAFGPKGLILGVTSKPKGFDVFVLGLRSGLGIGQVEDKASAASRVWCSKVRSFWPKSQQTVRP